MLRQLIRRPAPVIDGQPDEELAIRGGGATFPNSPPRKEPDRTNKHGEIS